MLWLNGRQVKGYGLKVSADFSIENEDMSGNSSKTASAEKGKKGKSLNVSLGIRYQDDADLKALLALAEGNDGHGESVLYNIQNRTAKAMGIRQVKFNGSLSAKENDTLAAWDVSFQLAEHRSVPEKKEERQPKQSVSEQTANGQPATPAGGTAANASPEPAQELSGVEKWLQRAENWVTQKKDGP